MRSNPFFSVIAVLGILLWSLTAFGEEKEVQGGAVAAISALQYDFGSVIEGEIVTHDFILHNQGNAVLEVRAVKTG